jgi:hypothetical protein
VFCFIDIVAFNGIRDDIITSRKTTNGEGEAGMHPSHSITSLARTRIDVGMMMANPNRCEDALPG